MVRRWKQTIRLCDELNMNDTARRIIGGGRKPTIKELEDSIFDWIVERRSRSLVVRRKDIQEMGVRISSEQNYLLPFKASSAWVDGFMKRYNLSLRRSTTLFKLLDEEIVRRVICFKHFIEAIDFSLYRDQNVIAMDETAIYYGENTQTTIDKIGSSSIQVPSTGYESLRVTCVLAIRRNCQKLTPLIISRGRKNCITNNNNVWVLETEKAWSTQEAIRIWLDKAIPMILRGSDRGLIIWDSASTHRAKEMKIFLLKRRIDQIMIPAGTTPYLQSLDIVINKPFKDYMRTEINDYIEHRQTRNSKGNIVKPPISKVIGWVGRSWAKIGCEIVENALKSGYLYPGQVFGETYIVKHEKLGRLIEESLQIL